VPLCLCLLSGADCRSDGLAHAGKAMLRCAALHAAQRCVPPPPPPARPLTACSMARRGPVGGYSPVPIG
jgi:hypothetical protein